MSRDIAPGHSQPGCLLIIAGLTVVLLLAAVRVLTRFARRVARRTRIGARPRKPAQGEAQ